MDGLRENWVAPDRIAYDVITREIIPSGSSECQGRRIEFSVRGERKTWATDCRSAQHPKQMQDFELRDYFAFAKRNPPVFE